MMKGGKEGISRPNRGGAQPEQRGNEKLLRFAYALAMAHAQNEGRHFSGPKSKEEEKHRTVDDGAVPAKQVNREGSVTLITAASRALC
jgi:hypothetical protein